MGKRDVVALSAVRSAIGSFGGWLSDSEPHEVANTGNAYLIFPHDHPALFAMPLAFIVAYAVSKLDRSAAASRERAALDDRFVRAETGPAH